MRYFLTVVDHGSVNATANALGVAQPTISQALRSLERELRTRLFHLIGRGTVPRRPPRRRAVCAPSWRLNRQGWQRASRRPTRARMANTETAEGRRQRRRREGWLHDRLHERVQTLDDQQRC
ncbi:helix-turn-helix domain-containing protein, partial [Intrasporangium chromatireducens]|uniref:helix-turn-helix domain-containing protein n=1 Tax=Intrasporangium chromatireducens TaxID=1386088 RepID=UPI0012DC543B